MGIELAGFPYLPGDGIGNLLSLEQPHPALATCLEDIARDLERLDLLAPRSAQAPPAAALSAVQNLFHALKEKDAATAAHSMRATLGCALWAERLRLDADERDAIESAALLHDIGKMVAPPALLRKPGPLTEQERATLQLCRRVGLEVVRDKIALPAVLEIVSHAGAWYDGSRRIVAPPAHDLPLGARMLAIIDAFDAMTFDQSYREAIPVDRALAELQRYAGTQFDPQLVENFCRLPLEELLRLRESAQRHFGDLPPRAAPVDAHFPLRLFQDQLLEQLSDAVAFLDREGRIAFWSDSAARLTGISKLESRGVRWTPALLHLRDGSGARLTEGDCPVAYVLANGKPWARRVLLRRADGELIAVDAQALPVTGDDGAVRGATLLLRDLSPEESLRARCFNLQQLITRDGLTQVANRAEFDRAHAQAVARALEDGSPYSLILCDIDHFKHINDRYGHPVGDEVLKRFAQLLERACRQNDLVARYGGEEFAVICRECELAVAASRAEAMRAELANLLHSELGDRSITASFGVTAVESGDTPATVLVRADQALYQAKRGGRDQVVAIGSVGPVAAEPTPDDRVVAEQVMTTTVPPPIAVEKLRGFIADHQAELIEVDEQRVRIKLDASRVKGRRRLGDRRVDCFLDVAFEALEPFEAKPERGPQVGANRTRIHVAVVALRSRDRRRKAFRELAGEMLTCFRSYLMADVADMAEVDQPLQTS